MRRQSQLVERRRRVEGAVVNGWEPRGLSVPARWRSAAALMALRADVGSSYYVECRLGPMASPQLDVLVCVPRVRRPALRAWLGTDGCASSGLRRLGEQWSDEPGSEFEEVSAVWLEYDEVAPDRPTGVPSASVCVASDYADYLGPQARVEVDGQLALLGRIHGALRGAALDSLAQDRLHRCLAALPEEGRLLDYSIMLGRSGAPQKLYLCVPSEALLDYLAAVGWRGAKADVGALVEEMFPASRVGGELYLDLFLDDLTVPGGNRIGLGYTPQHLARSDEPDPTRASTLSACVAAGLCTREQEQALRRWPCGTLAELDFVDRWLDLKLVRDPDGRTALKAYLGLSVRVASAFDRMARASEQGGEGGNRGQVVAVEAPPAGRTA